MDTRHGWFLHGLLPLIILQELYVGCKNPSAAYLH